MHGRGHDQPSLEPFSLIAKNFTRGPFIMIIIIIIIIINTFSKTANLPLGPL